MRVAVVLLTVVPLDRVARVVLVNGDEVLAEWDIHCDGRPAVALLDELARMQLAARRLGLAIIVRDADTRLADVIALAGLTDVLHS
ncbi:MAG TPA: hypothetical protein VFA83_16095 [Acidimicrobiales bacterium]|nr:hypothetical protein [Acidimicrobiales bacterium]